MRRVPLHRAAASDRVQTRKPGVLTVTIRPRGPVSHTWAPGKIVDGRPVLLTGAEKQQAAARIQNLSC